MVSAANRAQLSSDAQAPGRAVKVPGSTLGPEVESNAKS